MEFPKVNRRTLVLGILSVALAGAAGIPLIKLAGRRTIVVHDAAELEAALGQVQAGTIIRMEPGKYGQFSLTGMTARFRSSDPLDWRVVD